MYFCEATASSIVEKRSLVKRQKNRQYICLFRKRSIFILRRESCVEKGDKDHCQAEAEDSSDHDLACPVTDTFFEMWEFALIYFSMKLIDQHIEVASLVAEYHPDAEGVIDDDEGESDGDREGSRVHALEVTDGGEK